MPDPDALDVSLQLLQVSGATARRGVPPVENGVHHNLLRLEVLLLGHLEQCNGMVNVTVDSAIRNQAHQVQPFAGPPHLAQCFE